MDDHLRIRALLKERFPTTYVVLQASNTRRNILMWEISDGKLFNFDVERRKVLEVLESDMPLSDCYAFFQAISLPKHAINDFRELVLKFSKK